MINMLRPSSRSLLRHARFQPQRHLHTPTSAPHAYLRPLLSTIPAAQITPDTEELEGVMSLVMDRKETRNALSVRMVSELREGIAKVSSDNSARVLLLHTPHPNVFCSGADLRERLSMSPGAVSDFLDSLRSLLAELEALSIPTVAIIDGPALGGGCELSLGCDIRVGGPGTIISLPEAKLGIVPGAGGTVRATRLLGVSRTKELIYTGRKINGDEAERIGLLNICAKAPQTALSEALLLCRQMITSAPLSLRAAKKAIDMAPYIPFEEGLDMERKVYDSLLGTADRMEGLRAFKEKRRARFIGS